MPLRTCFSFTASTVAALAFALVGPSARATEPVAKPTDQPVGFVKDVLPIFLESCIACHTPKVKKGGYDMTTIENILKGGRRGEAVLPGDIDSSVLSLMLHGEEDPLMPFETDPLDAKEIAVVDAWILQGAKFDGPDPKVDL
ncbi:MAG: c-type cytochrome domain-containing protein, partial [Planctomycetia bacterium]